MAGARARASGQVGENVLVNSVTLWPQGVVPRQYRPSCRN